MKLINFSSLLALDRAKLKKGDIIVDVGGGVGSTALILAKANPHLRFIIQDRPAVTVDGEKVIFLSLSRYNHEHSTQFWKAEYPEALVDSRVQFQGAVFFKF